MTVATVDMGEDNTTPWVTPNSIRAPELVIYISTAVVQSGAPPSIMPVPTQEIKKKKDRW